MFIAAKCNQYKENPIVYLQIWFNLKLFGHVILKCL